MLIDPWLSTQLEEEEGVTRPVAAGAAARGRGGGRPRLHHARARRPPRPAHARRDRAPGARRDLPRPRAGRRPARGGGRGATRIHPAHAGVALEAAGARVTAVPAAHELHPDAFGGYRLLARRARRPPRAQLPDRAGRPRDLPRRRHGLVARARGRAARAHARRRDPADQRARRDARGRGPLGQPDRRRGRGARGRGRRRRWPCRATSTAWPATSATRRRSCAALAEREPRIRRARAAPGRALRPPGLSGGRRCPGSITCAPGAGRRSCCSRGSAWRRGVAAGRRAARARARRVVGRPARLRRLGGAAGRRAVRDRGAHRRRPRRFLARRGLDRPHVAGNSLGAAVALELGSAARSPRSPRSRRPASRPARGASSRGSRSG